MIIVRQFIVTFSLDIYYIWYPYIFPAHLLHSMKIKSESHDKSNRVSLLREVIIFTYINEETLESIAQALAHIDLSENEEIEVLRLSKVDLLLEKFLDLKTQYLINLVKHRDYRSENND